MGKWDWQVFLQDTGGGRTYLAWLMSAWGWTLSVAVMSLVVALLVGSLMGILRTTPNKWFMQPIPPTNTKVGLPASELTKAAWANPSDKPLEDYAKK